MNHGKHDPVVVGRQVRVLAAAGNVFLPGWSLGPLKRYSDHRRGEIRTGIQVLSDNAIDMAVRWNASSRTVLGAVFGDLDWPAHAFRVVPIEWGIKLSEPQVTLAWAHFLGDGAPADLRNRRCATFLQALDAAAGQKTDWIDALTAMPGRVTVSAEVPLGSNGGRIDLLFEWIQGARRHRVGVELKLEHHVTPGQLEGYWGGLRSGSALHAGYLIRKTAGDDTNISLRSARAWGIVSWAGLLRRLETMMSDSVHADADPRYQLFRSSLWSRVLWW